MYVALLYLSLPIVNDPQNQLNGEHLWASLFVFLPCAFWSCPLPLKIISYLVAVIVGSPMDQGKWETV